MKETVVSESTGFEYCPADGIRLINPKQIAFYMLNNVKIMDFYPSKDFKTGEDILVFIVNKQDSQEAYREWNKKWTEQKNG